MLCPPLLLVCADYDALAFDGSPTAQKKHYELHDAATDGELERVKELIDMSPGSVNSRGPKNVREGGWGQDSTENSGQLFLWADSSEIL